MYTDTHTQTLSLTHIHVHIYTLPLTYTLAHMHVHTHSHICVGSRGTHTHRTAHTLTHTLIYIHALTHIYTHTHTYLYSQTLRETHTPIRLPPCGPLPGLGASCQSCNPFKSSVALKAAYPQTSMAVPQQLSRFFPRSLPRLCDPTRDISNATHTTGPQDISGTSLPLPSLSSGK